MTLLHNTEFDGKSWCCLLMAPRCWNVGLTVRRVSRTREGTQCPHECWLHPLVRPPRAQRARPTCGCQPAAPFSRARSGRLNGLRFTRAALIKRDVFLADSNAQNRPDLVDAQRRRVQARVGRLGLLQPSVSSAHGYTSSKVSLKRSGLHQQLHTQVQLECVGARSR